MYAEAGIHRFMISLARWQEEPDDRLGGLHHRCREAHGPMRLPLP